jgi:ubiquinone/menaquinone biosynthesis C-methylase UbiE
MEAVRAYHNSVKRHLIQSVAQPGHRALDVGCGFGGDLQKWKHCQVKVDMCDPRLESLAEAQKRAEGLHMKVDFFEGDISSCPNKMYDIICYNFSLHYIFQNKNLFFKSIHGITSRLKKGGHLIGCIPDSESILMSTPFKDGFGNVLTRGGDTGCGEFGETVSVFLADTPYYGDGKSKPEPIAYKDLLVTHLAKVGIQLVQWTPLDKYEISKLYSVFIFMCT